MAKAIRFHETGGPEVLKLETVEVGEPGPGQARVRHTYVAVNFIDIYFRTGRYPLPLPNGLGSDAVGVVEAVGEGVTDIRAGDRVGYLLGPQGAYSDVRVMPADVLIPLPDGVSDRTASTLMMKGMTAQYLFRQVYPLQGRRDDPLPRGRRRRRPDRLPVGARDRRDHDRHRQHRREGRDRAGQRLRPHHRHLAREHRRAGARDHRRQGRAGGLRLGRQGHADGLARQPAAARHAGQQRHHARARS